MLSPQQEQRFSSLIDRSLTGYMTPDEKNELRFLKDKRDAPLTEAEAAEREMMISAWLRTAERWELLDLLTALAPRLSPDNTMFIYHYLVARLPS